jgi:hypothetical protein
MYLAITAFFCKLKVTLEENARPGKDDEYFQEVMQSYAFLRSVKTPFSTIGDSCAQLHRRQHPVAPCRPVRWLLL